jgi:hypothetical protein
MGILLSLPFAQTKLGQYATNELNTEFGTDISISRIAITPFGTVKLKGILVRDHHQDTLFYIKSLNTSILNVNKLFNEGHPHLGDAIFHGLDVHIHQFKGEDYTNLDKFIEAFDDGSPSSGKFRMKIASMTIFNSRFRYTDENLETPKILDFKKMKGKLDDFFIKGPNVYTLIEKLSFLDHRGMQIEQLTANFTYTKSNILLQNLAAHTKESEVEGIVELRYKREDFTDFNNKVIFDVNFEKATIASNDLNYFYNEFGKNNLFFVNTHLIGTLNNFTTENLKLIDKNQSEIIGNITFKNLFHKQKSFYIEGKLDRVASNYNNLKAILPNILGTRLPASLEKLGNVTISGAVELTDAYINSKVYLSSNLGEVLADLAIQDLGNIDNAIYQGTIALGKFQLGAFLGENEIGWTNLDVVVDGQGFNQKYLNTKIKGKIDNFVYSGYNYSNITVDGVMKMPYFKGYFNSNDPNLRMDFDGLVDMSSVVKNYNFKANIDYADLQELNWVKTDTFSIFKGNLIFDAKGNTIDDLDGNLNFKNVSYQNSKASYFFEDFAVVSSFDENSIRTITVDSKDIVNGKVVGKYKIAEVQKIVENAVGSLYANYSPNVLKEGQFLDFNFYIHNKIVEVFLPDVIIAKNTKIKGKINADEGRFEFDFKSPKIEAFKNKFDNISIDIDNKNPLYNTYIEMDSLRLKNYKISDFSLINVTMNDTLFFRTEFNGGSKNQDQFALNLYHTINENKQSVIGFKKSEINLKEYLWFINEKETNDNNITFDKTLQNFNFEKISLSHKEQNINFYGTMKDSSYKDLNLVFNDVDLEKITPSVDSLFFRGKLNGFASVQQEKGQFKPESNITIDALKINEYPIGDFIFNIRGNESFNQFIINSYIKDKDEDRFSVEGKLDYKNKVSELDLEARFMAFDLAPFGPLLSSIVSDVRGNTTGRATIAGSLNNPEINGRLYLNESGLKIPYLNTDYNFEPNAIVDVTERQFLFRNIKITDTKFNTNGILRGSVRHEVFDDWEIDLEVRSDNILALDTKDGEDVYYYGTAFLNGFATVKGPTNALAINVAGESEKGTSIKIPVNDSEEVGDNSFLNFITREQKFNNENGIINAVSNYQGIELDFDFDINTNAEIEVILDRNSGHSMKGTGYGSMKMEINTLGKFLMYGDFQIMEGSYSFKYGGLIDKKFNVKPGGTIRWYGEPMNAVLDLEAIYSTQANPALLLESASFNRKVDTNVSIVIQGNLSNPQPDFTIDFPNVSSVLKSEIDYKLQDKDTRQTQALALLSAGSFMTAENVGNVAYGPLFERASSLFSDLFSDEDSKLQLGVDYSQGDRINQISDRVGVTLNTQINEKISINGRVGVPVGGVAESVLIGNVEIQMQLNEDGSLRARVFNRENDINYIGEGIGYTQGIGLTYNVDFDNFKEFIQKVFTKKNQEQKQSQNSNEFPDSDLPPDFLNFINERKNKKSETSKEPIEEKEKVPEMD